MERLNHFIEITKSSYHLPAFLSFLVGMLVVNKRVYSNREDNDILGDNLPLTLIDSLSRIKNRTLSCRSAKPG